MGAPRINLDKLVRRIGLDISLLEWFATQGGRRFAVLSAISLARIRILYSAASLKADGMACADSGLRLTRSCRRSRDT